MPRCEKARLEEKDRRLSKIETRRFLDLIMKKQTIPLQETMRAYANSNNHITTAASQSHAHTTVSPPLRTQLRTTDLKCWKRKLSSTTPRFNQSHPTPRRKYDLSVAPDSASSFTLPSLVFLVRFTVDSSVEEIQADDLVLTQTTPNHDAFGSLLLAVHKPVGILLGLVVHVLSAYLAANLIPVTAFGLGTWQVKRRKWKLELIENLAKRFNAPPQNLPYDLSELNEMEYSSVRVKGQFDHSQELYMGPRSLLMGGDAAGQGGMFSQSSGSQTGYLVITPFHLADRDLTILVNRGWVPAKMKNPEQRKHGQVEGEVELVGLVRLNETRPTFTPKNSANTLLYRDLEQMAEMVGAAPVYLEATESSSVPGGPIGGQTRISLRNEHMYSLGGITAFMWYRRFIRGIPLM
uniref:SURF1-like protein n=1 Tax=Timema shepardi TaxID=629360 RepID=A0A7R9ANH2_TIMSH|nr:unnamed protein product [Timema shepardi]